MQIITDGELPFFDYVKRGSLSFSDCDIGFAVDIGTTTIAVLCWHLASAKLLSQSCESNCQINYGKDVISRISYTINNSDGENILHNLVINQIQNLIKSCLLKASCKMQRGVRPVIKKIIMTGNTTMLSFAAGFSVKSLSAFPFKSPSDFDITLPWASLCKNDTVVKNDTEVYFPPCPSSFVGADTLCALLCTEFTGLNEKAESIEDSFIMCDIGTNSEIVLYSSGKLNAREKLIATACSAGPAFEGGNIELGMSACEGAVYEVSACDKGFSVKTIGDTEAKGICGSGLISCIDACIKKGLVDKEGVIVNGDKIYISKNVYVTQNDIRNFQLAKAALMTGFDYLQKRGTKVKKIYLAGGFGSKIDISQSKSIKMLPSVEDNTFKIIGNAALYGASAMLYDDRIINIVKTYKKQINVVNLAAVPDFQKSYICNLSL